MVSHNLAIAKATFAASLLRSDPLFEPIPRDMVSDFHVLLDATVAQCSPANVQACREWISSHIASSASRTAALGKFLNVLAQSFSSEDDDNFLPKKRLSPQRKRLHILYVLNDVLHWTKYHNRRPESAETFAQSLEPNLVDIFAASEDRDQNHSKFSNLLSLWDKQRYFPPDIIDILRRAVESQQSGKKSQAQADHYMQSEAKEAPWSLPPTHGDPSTPYYDLPAGNLVPHIIEGSKRPIRARAVKALQFPPGPADEKLVTIVKEFIQEVEHIYNKSDPNHGVVDVDFMGQPVVLNEMDERVVRDSYYGWSREFCEAIQRRRKGSDERSRSRSRGSSYRSYSKSRSRSRSRSNSPRKRRRSHSPDRDNRRRRSRSAYSQSRSPSPRREQAMPLSHPVPPPSFMANVPIPPKPANWQGPWPPPPPPPPSMLNSQFPRGVPPPPPTFVPGMQVPFPFPLPLGVGQASSAIPPRPRGNFTQGHWNQEQERQRSDEARDPRRR